MISNKVATADAKIDVLEGDAKYWRSMQIIDSLTRASSKLPFDCSGFSVIAWGTIVDGTTDRWSESLACPVLRCSAYVSDISYHW